MDHYDKFFKEELGKLGYQTLYVSKKPGNSQADGLCIAWKSRFSLLQSFSENFASTMSHLPEATPNIAIFAAFKDEQTGRRLVVANSHLYWHWDHDGLRAVQAEYLFESLMKWIVKWQLEDAEVLVCGDFNSDPSSVAYRLISRRSIPDDYYSTVMQNTGFDACALERVKHHFDLDKEQCPPFRSAYACQLIEVGKQYGGYGELLWSTYNPYKGTA